MQAIDMKKKMCLKIGLPLRELARIFLTFGARKAHISSFAVKPLALYNPRSHAPFAPFYLNYIKCFQK